MSEFQTPRVQKPTLLKNSPELWHHLQIQWPQSAIVETDSLLEQEKSFLVSIATTTPTGDNCQPFEWVWDEDNLKIYHKPQRAKHVFNNDNAASKISLGAIYSCLKIAGTTINLIPHFQTTDDFSKSLWSSITWERTPLNSDPLASAILSRLTDRRPYQKSPFATEPLFETAQQIAEQYPLIEFSLVRQPSPQFRRFLKKSESYLFKNSTAFTDFMNWVRLDEQEIHNTFDGLNYESIGLKKADTIPFRLLRKFPKLAHYLWPFGLGLKVQKMAMDALLSSTALYLLSTKEHSSEALIQVGRAGFEIWTHLCQHDFGVQPISAPSLSAYDLQTGHVNPSMNAYYQKLFNDGHQIMSREFLLAKDVTPCWLFRTGFSPDYPTQFRTQRKPLNQVMSINPPERNPIALKAQIANTPAQKKETTELNIKNISTNGFMAHSKSRLLIDSVIEINFKMESNKYDLTHQNIHCKVKWQNKKGDCGFEVLEPQSNTQNWLSIIDKVL